MSAAAYAPECPAPSDGIVITKHINNAEPDAQGFIARQDASGDQVVAFRGTSNLQDSKIDLKDHLVPFQTQVVTGCTGRMLSNCIPAKSFESVYCTLR